MKGQLVRHLRVVFLLYVITFVMIVPIISYFLPLSKLYKVFHRIKNSKEYADSLNTERLLTAKSYFNRLDQNDSLNFYINQGSGKVDIIFVIVTVKRQHNDLNLGYFLQTASAMDRILKKDVAFGKSQLMVCNVDKNPQLHDGANRAAHFIPTINKMDYVKHHNTTSNIARQNMYRQTAFSNKYEKETIDYLFCLETASLKNSTYIALIEDDAYPMDTFIEVVKFIIDYRIQTDNKDFVFLKLFYPLKWQGFAFELTRILEIIAIGSVGSGISVLMYCCYNRRRLKNSVLYIYFISVAIYFILLALVVSRQNVLELRRFSKHFYTLKKSPGCCTPAMLYYQPEIRDLVNFLQSDMSNQHIDLSLSKYVDISHKNAFQIEPNLFYHLGLYTSLAGGEKKPEEFIFQV